MKDFIEKVTIKAADPIQAKVIAKGLQNIANELAGNEDFLIEIADPAEARKYANKIKSLINNPVLKKLAGGL